MKHILAVSLLAFAFPAQQAITPQPTPTPNSQPCVPAQPAPSVTIHPDKIKPLNNGLSKLGGLFNKATGGIISAPSVADVSNAMKPVPVPCKAPAPAPTKPVPVPEPVNAKPAFVCPPKSSLIPNHPYCIYPDYTVVDAIPLSAKSDQPTPQSVK